ncbi:MAG: protein kinase [Pirellulaceae bacterium]
MPVASSTDFWKLVLDAKLLPKEVCKGLNDQFKQLPGGKSDAKSLAQFLVKSKQLTPYQAKAVLAGKANSLVIGGYTVLDIRQEGVPQPCLSAIHTETAHPVWLHKIPKAISRSEAHLGIVQRMCQMRCTTPHPHLIRCFELLEQQGRHFLVTEQLGGNLLQESRPEGGAPIPPPDSSRLIRQLTLAVDHLHRQGMVVRDITREHLWLEETGNLKLMHLPLSPLEPIAWKTSEPSAALQSLASIAAPELATEGAIPSTHSDLYAIGCHYFDLLTGDMPFTGDIPAKLERHAKEPVPQPPYVPAAVMQILIYLLAKNPNVRYQSAGDVAEAIRSFVDPAQMAPPAASVPPTLGPYLQAVSGIAPPAAAAVPPQPPPFPGGEAPAPPFPAAPAPFPEAMPPQPPMPPIPSAGPPPFAGAPAAAPMATVPPPVAMPVAGTPIGVPMAQAVAQPSDGGTSRASAMSEKIRKRKLQKKITNLVILGVLAVGVLVGGLMAPSLFRPDDEVVQVDPVPVEQEEEVPDETVEQAPPKTEGSQLVEDDGKTLWAAPSSAGEPLDLTGLPPDTKLILHARPSQWTRTPQGERTLRALGPDFAAVRAELETSLAVPFDSIDELLIGIGPSTPASFPCVVVRVSVSTDFPNRWGNPEAEGPESLPLYSVNGWKATPLPGSPNQGFIAGSPTAMDAMATSGLGKPNLSRELEQLRRSSDDSRHLSILIDPQYLLGSTSQALPTRLVSAGPAIRQFLGDGLRGGLFSANLGDSLYIEMRLAGSLNQNPETLAQTMRERLQSGAQRLEDEIPNLNPTSYWRRLANRFPMMVRFAYQNARSGSENNLAVVNVILPPNAAQNLVAASELMLAAQSGPTGGGAQMADSPQKKPETIAGKLQSKISIQFPQNSLEFAIRDLGEEADVSMQIIGGDLQMEGITRNQEIKDFDQQDKPFEEVLVALLMRANPVTTVTAPTEEDQKLIYVIDPLDGPEDEKKVLITTRVAAKAKGYTIPAVFTQ